jgi:hypothetical protein
VAERVALGAGDAPTDADGSSSWLPQSAPEWILRQSAPEPVLQSPHDRDRDVYEKRLKDVAWVGIRRPS